MPNKDKDKEVVTTQWEMGDIEKAGLLKMDFLGLRTLTSLEAAVKLVEKTRGEPIDLYRFAARRSRTYKLLQRGDAKGVFQFESAASATCSNEPDRFATSSPPRSLSARSAHGGMVDEYVNRKHGREKPVYPHPVMEEILGETYGVMVYQEQIMRILNRLGGIELSSGVRLHQGDQQEEVRDHRPVEGRVHRGAGERGLTKRPAGKIFDLIDHLRRLRLQQVAQRRLCPVAYQTAYLKAHYPTEFMAALLSSEMDGTEREKYFVEHIDDCKRWGSRCCRPTSTRESRCSRSPPREKLLSVWGRSRESASRPSMRSPRGARGTVPGARRPL